MPCGSLVNLYVNVFVLFYNYTLKIVHVKVFITLSSLWLWIPNDTICLSMLIAGCVSGSTDQ